MAANGELPAGDAFVGGEIGCFEFLRGLLPRLLNRPVGEVDAERFRERGEASPGDLLDELRLDARIIPVEGGFERGEGAALRGEGVEGVVRLEEARRELAGAGEGRELLHGWLRAAVGNAQSRVLERGKQTTHCAASRPSFPSTGFSISRVSRKTTSARNAKVESRISGVVAVR